MLLSSGCWVNCRLVQNHEIWCVLLQNILVNIQYGCIKLHHRVIFVEQIISLRKMSGVIENSLCCLGSSLLSHGNLVVKILWNWSLDNLRDHIGWDSMRLHAHNPVINGELSLSLLDDLIELLDGLFI